MARFNKAWQAVFGTGSRPERNILKSHLRLRSFAITRDLCSSLYFLSILRSPSSQTVLAPFAKADIRHKQLAQGNRFAAQSGRCVVRRKRSLRVVSPSLTSRHGSVTSKRRRADCRTLDSVRPALTTPGHPKSLKGVSDDVFRGLTARVKSPEADPAARPARTAGDLRPGDRDRRQHYGLAPEHTPS
jgi:hypothetical protein